jgi:hypothetical protein
MRFLTSLLVLPLIVATVSVTAGARENHCDHNDGKTSGIIGGAVVGGILGAALGHGRGGNIALGAGGGAVVGGLMGDSSDDRKDFEECGTDSESYQRQVSRDQDRFEDQAAAREQREREIEFDRDQSRMHRRPMPRPYPPRRYPYKVYECQDLGRGYGLVNIRYNTVVPNHYWGWDLRGCQQDERYMNGYGY